MATNRSFPLQWPSGWTRTHASTRRRAPYKVTPSRAIEELFQEVRRFGAIAPIVLSSNLPLRRDGLPTADEGLRVDDPGVALYWTTRSHGERVIACDKWTSAHANIRALGLAVTALRSLERSGATQVLERAFTAFGALPAAASVPAVRPWWEVLGFPEALIGSLSMPVIDARYRELAVAAHPDRGGSVAAMTELNGARTQARDHYQVQVKA